MNPASPERTDVERVPFSLAGRALLEEIHRRHQLELGAALDRIGADVGCAAEDGWQPDLRAGAFTRPAAATSPGAPAIQPANEPANDPPRVIVPPSSPEPPSKSPAENPHD